VVLKTLERQRTVGVAAFTRRSFDSHATDVVVECVNHVVEVRRSRQLVARDAVVVAMATTWRRQVRGIVTADIHELR